MSADIVMDLMLAQAKVSALNADVRILSNMLAMANARADRWEQRCMAERERIRRLRNFMRDLCTCSKPECVESAYRIALEHLIGPEEA